MRLRHEESENLRVEPLVSVVGRVGAPLFELLRIEEMSLDEVGTVREDRWPLSPGLADCR
jgi:hypothetical protein